VAISRVIGTIVTIILAILTFAAIVASTFENKYLETFFLVFIFLIITAGMNRLVDYHGD
jgi:uncharacterized protein YqhQ